MKPVIIDMKDLSESTEIYEKKPNPAIVWFVYVLLAIIVISIIWMATTEIDIVSEVGGTISYTSDVTEVTCAYNAKVTKCNVADGQFVWDGTVLYELKVVGGDKTPKDEELEDEQLVIKAKGDGYFFTALDGGVGTVLQADSRVGYLFPKPQKSFQAQIYVTGGDIGKVTEGQEVSLEFVAFPASEYGTVTGRVRKISDTVEFDPQSGTSYCSAWVEFDATELTDGKNKSVPLKSGLVCTVKIITDRMKVLPYVWEKIR